jgi:mannose-6-phosphate isomerase-like protein (cupin superfamily)
MDISGGSFVGVDGEPIRPARALRLDEIEGVTVEGLTWHPVRLELGLRAFGTNAYSAERPGQDVVEPHTESLELAHEELYFVARGRATFTVDGREIDAPAGTYVFVPDPRSHRYAVAAEADTWLLSFGGPPTFTPSAWEWNFRARAMRSHDPDGARELLEEGLRVMPDSGALHYELACLLALQGEREAALAELRAAVALEPKLAVAAREDEDLASLREELGD